MKTTNNKTRQCESFGTRTGRTAGVLTIGVLIAAFTSPCDHAWGDTAGTRRLAAADGWIRTGDLAVRNSLGLVRLVGRAKDVIKCAGYAVLPLEIEEALAAHPAVARAAVVGVPHPDDGEQPVGVVECRDGSVATEAELLEWCRQRLAAYKRPRQIACVPAGTLPIGVTDKVQRSVLRASVSALHAPLSVTAPDPRVTAP